MAEVALTHAQDAWTRQLAEAVIVEQQREIAEMAARGLSNRAIAARLTVSVRTVEGHLYRAGLKLGVSERAALADVLGVE